MSKPFDGPTIECIRDAARQLAPYVVRTPLLAFNDYRDSTNIFLKLENLQSVGSFKVRAMGNALLAADSDALESGAYTASSGNAGLGLAWMAKKLNVPARVYVPHSAPAGKLQRIRELGASVQAMPDRDWWQIIRDCGHPNDPGVYLDAVRNRSAMAGNGTIGLEILEQLPEVETVIVPFGGGGVGCGIGAALRALKPATRLVVAEADSAAPVTAAFAAGRPTEIPVVRTFISGAGAPCVLPEMWPLVSALVNDTALVSVAEVEDAIRSLAENHRLVVEGAGAIPVAAARSMAPAAAPTVCVVTGGNIDREAFGEIIARVP